MIGELDTGARDYLHVQLQSFVDTKLLLGYRYNEWALRAPSMEDANAIQGQAANEFGQANHFMTALEGMGTDPDEYVARDDPREYKNLQVLDEGPDSWSAFLATVGFADMATQVRLQSFEESPITELAEPAGKAIQEEEFHTQYLAGAVKTYLVDDPEMTVRFREVLADVVPTVLYWFGPETDTTSALVDDGVLTQSPDQERRRYLSRVTSFIDNQFDRSFAPDGTEPEALLAELDWSEWDQQRLRTTGGGPDEAAVDALRITGMDAALGLE
jgi:1,2-phenylacetyl-CoA epoxidase catalytic subunit